MGISTSITSNSDDNNTDDERLLGLVVRRRIVLRKGTEPSDVEGGGSGKMVLCNWEVVVVLSTISMSMSMSMLLSSLIGVRIEVGVFLRLRMPNQSDVEPVALDGGVQAASIVHGLNVGGDVRVVDCRCRLRGGLRSGNSSLSIEMAPRDSSSSLVKS